MIGSLIQFGGFLSHTGTGFQREVKKSKLNQPEPWKPLLPHSSCPIHAVSPFPAQSMFRGDTLFELSSCHLPVSSALLTVL